jgi:hypothetical protein
MAHCIEDIVWRNAMSATACDVKVNTVASLPSDDIVILASNTLWRVPWELMMLGPFTSCGLCDGDLIRHVTVPAMVASAVRRRTTPHDVLVPCDYPLLSVMASQMPLLEAAVLVVETGWEVAVIIDHEPRVITARAVYRALVASGELVTTPAPDCVRPHATATP